MTVMDDVGGVIWQYLDPEDRGRLRLVSRASRQAADLHIKALTLDLGTTPATAAAGPQSVAQWGSNDISHGQSSRQLKAEVHRAAFLAAITRLQLLSWRSPAELTSELQRYGSGACPLQHLILRGSTDVDEATLDAVRNAFPHLLSLSIFLEGFPALRLGRGVGLRMRESSITKVVIEGCVTAPPEALASLAGLTQLHHLQLALLSRPVFGAAPLLLPANLSALTGLSRLQYCSALIADPGRRALPSGDLWDVVGLLAATQLTALRLPNVRQVGATRAGPAHLAGPAAAAAAPAAATPGAVATASPAPASLRGPAAAPAAALPLPLALLGDLRRLQTLEFSPAFMVDCGVFACLRQLTQLTRLRVHSIAAAAPSPGHLPLLQELVTGTQTPQQLLQTLLPLLPLPALKRLGTGSSLLLQCDHGGGAYTAGQLAAQLRTLTGYLAAAPQLQMRAKARLRCAAGAAAHLSLPQMADVVRPLAGRLSRLCLRGMQLGDAPWDQLSAALPQLRELKLRDCVVAADALHAILVALTGLRRLHLCRLDSGVTGAGLGLVAAKRARPLQLKVEPSLSAAVVAMCKGLQQQVFGQQHIQWLGEGDDFEP